jgi:cobalt-zinc-cadmium efflux system outer membrane protein
MKIRNLIFHLTLATTACTLPAQQSMPDMPGVPRTPQPTASQDKPNREPQRPDAMPGDMRGMGAGKNPRAKAAAASVRQSMRQQSGQGAAKTPSPQSDARSITVPFQELQEPEAVGFHTGSDLPAPDLLREVTARQPMRFGEFLAMADKDNPTLAQAERTVERSAQLARQAGLPPDPIVGYSGDHIRGGSYRGGEEGAYFSQEFVLGHKLALRRDVYRAQGRADELAVTVQRARIHNDVGRAFFDALAAQQSVVIHDRLLKVALDAETNAHELERVGQADAPDVLTAEIAAEQAEVDFVHAQRMFLAAFTRLATDAGQASLAPCPLEGDLVAPPLLDADGAAAADAQQSPATARAQAEVSAAEARLKDARRERLPDLNLKAGEWYSGEPLGNGLKTGWMSFAEAGVRLPLWNRNQGNIGAARAELDRAREDVTRTQLLTRNRAEPYAQQYQSARYTEEKYRTEMLPRARRAYQLEVTKYQQMAQSYPQVLTAQHMLFTLQLTYVQALDEEWRAAIALQNFTLTDGLDAPMSAGGDGTMLNPVTGQ